MEKSLVKIQLAGLKFLEPLTSAETFSIIVNEAIQVINADFATLYIEQEGQLEKVSSTLPVKDDFKARKKGYTYEAFVTGRPSVRYVDEFAVIHPELEKLGLKTNIFIPLMYRKKAIGVLVANLKRVEQYDEDQLEILKLFGSMASMAVRKTQLYEETKRALELRDKFISMAAHELRTPLTSVSGYIQLLHNRLAGENSVESRWTEQLLWESQRLTKLVTELLAVNRIKAGTLQYVWNECSMREIIKRSIDNFRLIYPQYQVVFNDQLGQKPDTVVGDYDKLLQVLSNLISNGIKFSPENEPIEIRLKDRGQDLSIEVIDRGVGIEKKEIRSIFEDYYKGSHNLKEGMGLGLSIVKTIVKQHHGEIQVKSKAGQGTTMTVLLPKPKHHGKSSQ